MNDLMNILKTAGPRMVPFGKSVAIYFMLVTFNPKGEIWTTILKCAPIVCLMIFILLYGLNFAKENKYTQRILCGLVFSCLGDALLNFNLFPQGMGSFAIAQIFYILAFGFEPLKLQIGLILYACGAAFVSLIFKSLEDILIIGLPIYATLLLTMCWRSMARAGHKSNFLTILCAIGSLLFVASDAFIAIDMFYSKIPNARIYIMTTYYAAQFAITLSIANEKKSEENNNATKLKESNPKQIANLKKPKLMKN